MTVPLPLLIVPHGGIPVVALPTLASRLFARYESAWAWGAKLAAENAMSAAEVSALLGVFPVAKHPLLPASVPRAARVLGKRLGFPSDQIECAFLGGALHCLRPLVCTQLRLCPACARDGYHFIIHQLRPFACCPLHNLPLRERCLRCGEVLAYALGESTAHGPISCPSCSAPQLPVSRGGYPKPSVISAQTFVLIERWLTFLRQRVGHPDLFDRVGAIDAIKLNRKRIQVIIPAKPARQSMALSLRGRWSGSAQYRGFETVYWEHANQHWRQCRQQSRQWYRGLLNGCSVELTPSPQILAFLYWRMTWQGCSNPYLLRRGHGLPWYGIAEWEAVRPIRYEDDFDEILIEFGKVLEASWDEWIACIELLNIKELCRHAWRMRAHPSSFISETDRSIKVRTNYYHNYFANSLTR